MTNERNRSSSNTPHRRTSAKRVAMPSARDELERERRLYSAHDERFSGGTPAQRYAGESSYAPKRQIHQGDFAAQPQSGQRVPRSGQRPTRRSVASRGGRATSRGGQATSRASQTAQREGQTAQRSGRTAQRGGQAGRRTAYSTQRTTVSGRQRAGMSERQSAIASERQRATSPVRQPAIAPMRQEGASAYGADRYRTIRSNRPSGGQAARRTLIAVAAVAVVAVVGVFGFQTWANAQPIEVTVNGQEVTLQADQRSVNGILDAGIVSATPGNYLAIDGSTLREGEGTRCTAQVNEVDTSDLDARLNDGDAITISDGTDLTEPYTDSDVEVLPYSVEVQGVGAVHLYNTDAQDGERVTRTGQESGKTAEIVTKEPVNRVVQYYNVDTNGDKVIALTFDDGPWDSQTSEILDILKENGAKATFFTVGSCISGHEDVVKRAADEGHEISTHTYDHAEGTGQGVSLILMSDQERKDEITKGYEAIEAVTGQEASTIVRCPGGNFDTAVATSLDGLITAEIGWNVDTNDWRRPGSDTIAQRIESAGAGSIVLMHDGGGDRSQTIEGLRQALPVLKEQGYEFVTVQELLERYPYEG